MMNDSYTIKDLIDIFLGKIWLIIICMLAGGGIAFCLAKFILPLEYSSHISMYVQSYTDIKDNDNANYNDISKSKQLINTYIEVLKDDAVMDSVGGQLLETFDSSIISQSFDFTEKGKIKPESLRASISITTVTDTSALTIVSTTKNAELSAAICNELAKQADSFIDSAIGVGTIKTIDTAKIYNTPVAPNIPKITMIGALLGLMIIVAIVMMLDFFDNTVKDSETLNKKYQKAILGEIDEIVSVSNEKDTKKKPDKKSSKDIKKRLTLLDKNIPFNVTESYKSMRTNIFFSMSTYEKKIFVVSSANPSEGKSTTSANIAITLAQGNHKVLIIDGDMRKPVQKDGIFSTKKSADVGLSTVLSKMGELDDCIHHETGVKNLDLLPSGKIPPNPSELLGSQRMEKLLNQLAERYDYIIIDAPPLNMVSDALVLSHYVAGLLLVVRYAFTTYEDVEDVVNKVKLADMNLLGFVLNDIRGKRHGGYYRYGKYGRYGRYGRYGHYGKYGYYKRGYGSYGSYGGYGYGYGYGQTPPATEEKKSDEK